MTIDALTPLQPDRGGRFEQLLDTTTGIAWTRDFPTSDYEISVEVMCASTEGNFCGVLFPVQSARWSLTLGFWGGRGQALLRALSGFAGPHQMRSVQVNLVPGRWHRVRLRVTERELEVWVNDKSLDELPAVRGASLAPYQTGDKEPFGLGAASGKTVLRKILVRRLDEGPEPGKKEKQPPGGP